MSLRFAVLRFALSYRPTGCLALRAVFGEFTFLDGR
jgi:hypothetical protein